MCCEGAEPRHIARFRFLGESAVNAIVTVKRSRADLLGEDDVPPTALPATVNAEALSVLLGLTPRMVYELSRREIVIRTGHGEYDLRKSVANYIKSIHKRADSDSLTQERIRQTKEAADQLAIKNAKAKGELLDAGEVEREWAGILRDVRAALLAMPSRMQQRVGTLTVADVAALDREVRDVLNQLGGDSVDS